MKLIIPLEIQIGAIKFAVLRNDKLLHKMNLSGYVNNLEQKIRIAHRKPDQEFLILVHEALHGICDELGVTVGDQNEEFIKSLATGITIFLQSLGIEPDFSQVPEEEKL